MRLAILALFTLTCAEPSTMSSTPPAETAAKPQYDVIVRNGEVLDGTGAPARRADVGIRGDAIAAIGDLSKATAAITLDAKNQVVAPGFIDLLGNSQSAVLIDPRLEGKVRQGVTTEVTGEGHSPGPIDEAMAAEMERTKPKGWPAVSWRSLGDFMQLVEKRGTAVNFAFYVGATNPREIVLGHAERAPTAEELRRMQTIVDEATKDGAVGIASALIYPPGRFATTDELIALAKHAPSYWTHLRNESSNIETAIDEALRIAREAKVPLNVFHLKIGGQQNWGRMPRVVAKIERARKDGVDVASCIYPYTATSTALESIVPAWALEGGYAQFVARLKDPAQRARVAAALKEGRLRDGGAATIFVRGHGKLDEVAKTMNVDAAEAAIRLFEGANTSPIGIYFSLDENDMKTALKQPWVAVCSDSGAVVDRSGGAHPRAYGTFPRILRYVREEQLIPLPEAVRKMTALAASRAGLADRGLLREGMKADVVVFDPKTVRDLSTYDDPHRFSEGIAHVVVNGKPVLRDGKITGALPGRILRPR